MTPQEFFKKDRFADNVGVELIEIKEGYAEARERYAGRSTGYYQIDITNQKGELVATFESSVFRKGDALPFAVPL